MKDNPGLLRKIATERKVCPRCSVVYEVGEQLVFSPSLLAWIHEEHHDSD